MTPNAEQMNGIRSKLFEIRDRFSSEEGFLAKINANASLTIDKLKEWIEEAKQQQGYQSSGESQVLHFFNFSLDVLQALYLVSESEGLESRDTSNNGINSMSSFFASTSSNEEKAGSNRERERIQRLQDELISVQV